MLPLVLAGACRLPSIEKSRSEKTYIYDLGGGFKHFLYSPLFGEDSQFDYSPGRMVGGDLSAYCSLKFEEIGPNSHVPTERYFTHNLE